MNQHPRAKEMGITPGEWVAGQLSVHVILPHGDLPYAEYKEICNMVDHQKSAYLIADAGNVMNQTGRTPSELVELVRELRENLIMAEELLDELGYAEHYPETCTRLNKCIESTGDIA